MLILLTSATHGMSQSMFHLPLPVAEKIARPVIVYVALILFLRLFGKRELAQLNPFDLVVLLSLSNTVQNAIIGDDNSVTGGIIGAFSLLAINWLLMWLLYRAPKLNKALEGAPAVLIRNGEIDHEACQKEHLTHEELISALNKNGFTDSTEVEVCILEPNGTFFVKGRSPSPDAAKQQELLEAVEQLTAEVRAMRTQLNAGSSPA